MSAQPAPGAPRRPTRILPVIVGAQFAGTSPWFAANAVLPDLQRALGLPADAVGSVTSAVQLGFIAGTLAFAFGSIPDRFSPRRVFFVCAIAAALANAAPLLLAPSLAGLLALRFAVGFFLAGIYPVGMRIAAGWYREGLGRALGYLVGALVLGTAFPWLLRALGAALPWQTVIGVVSLTAAAGGAAMLALVPDGPHLGRAARFDPRALAAVFASARFRASAFGYFGHMWELYAFYAFVPLVLAARLAAQADGAWPAGGAAARLAGWVFAVIAAGTLGCVVGGLASQRLGSARVAFWQLAASGACCLLSPWLFGAPLPVFLAFLLFWGVVVAGDSPQFSALNAASAPPDRVGSALTLANCIGFAITVASLQVLAQAAGPLGPRWLLVLLAPGPAFGLLAMRGLLAPPARTPG